MLLAIFAAPVIQTTRPPIVKDHFCHKSSRLKISICGPLGQYDYCTHANIRDFPFHSAMTPLCPGVTFTLARLSPLAGPVQTKSLGVGAKLSSARITVYVCLFFTASAAHRPLGFVAVSIIVDGCERIGPLIYVAPHRYYQCRCAYYKQGDSLNFIYGHDYY